jgi:hypothetical protein
VDDVEAITEDQEGEREVDGRWVDWSGGETWWLARRFCIHFLEDGGMDILSHFGGIEF